MSYDPSPEEIQYQWDHQDQDKSYQIFVTVAVVATLSIVFVILRLISRWLAKLPYWWDDYFIVFALIVNQTATVFGLLGLQYGSGRHTVTLPATSLERWLQLLFAYELGFIVNVYASKMSVLLMYCRIFRVSKPTWNLSNLDFYSWHWWVVLSSMTIWEITCFIMTIFQCTPIEAFWVRSIEGRCLSYQFFWVILFFNLLNDLGVVCLPLGRVWKLKLNYHQKLTLTAIFLLGGFICVTSIVRLYYTIAENDYNDITYTGIDSITWSCVETYVGIICANLPALAPLVRFCQDRKGSQMNRRMLGDRPRFSLSWHVPRRPETISYYAKGKADSSA